MLFITNVCFKKVKMCTGEEGWTESAGQFVRVRNYRVSMGGSVAGEKVYLHEGQDERLFNGACGSLKIDMLAAERVRAGSGAAGKGRCLGRVRDG